jgi:2-dehydropantoate 2-reductase
VLLSHLSTKPDQAHLRVLNMKICILGAGAVGTSFAVHLALAGHDVTLVARGARLDKLTRDGGVIATSPPTTPTPARVTVATAVDPTCAWDLVLVTVLAHQLDAALLGVLKSCPESTTVMFMFTTFAPLDEYRNAVGASRCVFGFPIIDARFVEPDGALKHVFISTGSRTLVADDKWCGVLAAAGIPTNLEPADLMQSWQRTHAGLTIGVIGLMNRAAARNGGVSWAEASLAARAVHAALSVVRRAGDHITPAPVAAVHAMPNAVLAALFWAVSRWSSQRDRIKSLGTREYVALTEALLRLAEGVGAAAEDVAAVRELREVALGSSSS